MHAIEHERKKSHAKKHEEKKKKDSPYFQIKGIYQKKRVMIKGVQKNI